jgi:membrane-bound serine protease (ClpP class)
MIAEAFQPSFGVLGLGGVVSFVTGSVILIDTELPGYGINLGVIAGFTVSTVTFFLLALAMVIRNRKQQVVTGQEEMVGAVCIALEDIADEGKVLVHGEHWKARTAQALKKGEQAKVLRMDGLVLDIRPATDKEDLS